LLSLERDQASQVLRLLQPQSLVEAIVPLLAKIGQVPPGEQEYVLHQAFTAAQTLHEAVEGGLDYAQEVLEHAFGSARAAAFLRRLTLEKDSDVPFRILMQADPEQAAKVLSGEHAQLVALILAHVPAAQSANIVAKLPPAMAADAMRRLAHLGHVDTTILHSLEEVLESMLTVTAPLETTGGIDHIVPILNASDPATERTVLDQLSLLDADLAESIRNELFTFEDLQKLDDEALQLIVRRAEKKTLAMALRQASHDVKDRIFANMTKQAAELLQDEIDTIRKVRFRDVEGAQHEITNLVHELENSGEIILPHGEAEEYLE